MKGKGEEEINFVSAVFIPRSALLMILRRLCTTRLCDLKHVIGGFTIATNEVITWGRTF